MFGYDTIKAGIASPKKGTSAGMISYQPFYETLRDRGITEYNLIYKQGVSANTIHRMKHGQAISTKTLDTLCFILNCGVSDIIEYVKDE